jgi:YVTN family beta-propeller protein
MYRFLLFTGFVFFAATTVAQKPSGIHLLTTYHIASAGGWDYIEANYGNKIYVSHGTQVNILNKNNGDSLDFIANTNGVHGIAFDAAQSKGFTSNGRLNNVSVFSTKTNKVITQIATGQNPDAIMYEPFSKKIITCNGRSKTLSFIDPIKNILTDSVSVGGKPETAVSDEEGKIYVNIEDKNEIVVIDAKTFKVINRWSLKPGEGPTGLAMDLKTKRLFVGCDKLLVVMDANTGKVIDKISIGDGCDGVVFDGETKNIFTSNGEGTMSVIHEDNKNKFRLTETVNTKIGARTISLDTKTHLLYLPTADFEPADPKVKGRPKMIPGSFQVLVYGK